MKTEQRNKTKLVQVTIDLNEVDYRDYANKAKELSARIQGNVSTAKLIRHAMSSKKAEILNLQTL